MTLTGNELDFHQSWKHTYVVFDLKLLSGSGVVAILGLSHLGELTHKDRRLPCESVGPLESL
jgi:hypothetical protein